MKVLHVVNISFVIPYFFGDQFKFMKDNDVESFIVCSKNENLKKYSIDYGFTKIEIPIRRQISFFQDLKSIFILIYYIKKNKIDIVVGHTPKGGLIASIAAFLSQTKCIYVRHGLNFETQTGVILLIMKAVEIICSRLSKLTINVSKSVLEKSVRENLGLKKNQTLLNVGTFNGVDSELKFNPKNYIIKKSNKTITFGFIGRLSKDKGFELIINSWNHLIQRHKNIQLIIAGPIDERKPVNNSYLRLMNDCQSIEYLGEISQPEYFYNQIDVLLLPSYREGFPTVVLEASSMKKAIVTTRATGCIDSIIEDKTGIYCDLNKESLIRSIEYYINNPTKISEHGENGRKFITNNFNNKLIWKHLLNTYKKIF